MYITDWMLPIHPHLILMQEIFLGCPCSGPIWHYYPVMLLLACLASGWTEELEKNRLMRNTGQIDSSCLHFLRLLDCNIPRLFQTH